MATWTKMKVDGLVKFEWANALKTHINVLSVYGNMPNLTVSEIQERIDSRPHPVIRQIYEDILKWVKDENKEVTNAVGTEPGS
jgi:hypothetical protein